MRIVLVGYGTRGDVQPIIALAKGLRCACHDVTVCAAENFGPWIQSHGVGFAPIHVNVQAMMQSEYGVAWVESRSYLSQLSVMRRLFEQVGAGVAKDILAAASSADLLIGGFTSDCFVGAAAEKQGDAHINAALQPWYPTTYGPATLVPTRARGHSLFNRLSGYMAERSLYNVFGRQMNILRRSLNLAPLSAQAYYNRVHAMQVLCGFSEHVVPRPSDWPENIVVTGYWFLDETAEWQVPFDLARFIDAGEPPVYIGFGSMSTSDTQGKSDTVVRAVRQSGRRAVIARGWAGLANEASSGDIFILKSAPHGWLFPRMAGVVHHGGAGTTAAAFQAGVPQFVVPHFADQPYWARRAYELGVAPKPVDQFKLTAETLTAGIQAVVDDAPLRQKASALGEAIRAEDGVKNAVRVIDRWIDQSGRSRGQSGRGTGSDR